MNIDWEIVIKIAVPLGTLVLGKYLDRWLEKRPKLLSYLGHSAAFPVRSNPPVTVHTHAIVVRNAGRVAANNVRIGHFVLPENFQLYPAVPHSVVREGSGVSEILIPTLVPGEQVTVFYLYFPPLLWSQIHSYTKSDEGFAKILKVLPTPQPARWQLMTAWALMFVGAVSLIYLLVGLIRWIIP